MLYITQSIAGMQHAGGVTTDKDEHEEQRWIAKATTIRVKLCERVEHHRTITKGEATTFVAAQCHTHAGSKDCRRMRPWQWLVGHKKASKQS